jgi:hypothetical protein
MSKVTVQIEEAVLNEAMRLYRDSYTSRMLNTLESDLEYKFSTHYNKNNECLLARLCEQYGSDKGGIKNEGLPYPWAPHTYADLYSRLFEHCRFSMERIFECGLGTNNPNLASNMGANGRPGASLRVWRDYFPNAQILGADIDRAVLFEEDRIKTGYMDQTNPHSIHEFWKILGMEGFDLMIDDGLHTFSAGVCLFENTISKLKSNGIYFIEDVGLDDLLSYKRYFHTTKYWVDYVIMFRPNLELGDNSLLVIRQA